MKVDIRGLSKAKVLCALYNAAQPAGLGVLQYDPTHMEEDEARQILAQFTAFDYYKGRPLQFDLSGDEFEARWYDRHNGGTGTAQRIVDSLR